MQEPGMRNYYNENKDFRHFVGMLDDLALLSIDEVPKGESPPLIVKSSWSTLIVLLYLGTFDQ